MTVNVTGFSIFTYIPRLGNLSMQTESFVLPRIHTLSKNELNRQSGDIDTSLLLEEFRREYQRSGQQIEIDFRKLVDWVRLGDQLTHQIHPYPAKLLPNIANFFVRAKLFHRKNNYILDPFCGSGTVALEASLAGYIPYVADSNPLALLITKVKTTPYNPKELLFSTERIIARSSSIKIAPEVNIVNNHLWYSHNCKKELEILLQAIMELDDEAEKDFFRVCFSVVARRLSMADPAISVPVRLKTKDKFSNSINEKINSRLRWINATSPSSEFLKVCKANINRIEETNALYAGRRIAIEVGDDARQLKIPGSNGHDLLECESIPLIVTSPPYGSAQKYIRATSLSLNWLGIAAPKELSALEAKTIGREHLPQFRQSARAEPLPDEYEKFIEIVQKKNETRGLITLKYLCEMKSALSEMARVISKDGRIVLVIGNNQVCGEVLRNDEFVKSVLESYGLTLEISLIDHIKSRGLMTKRNKTASIISRESVLVFKK